MIGIRKAVRDGLVPPPAGAETADHRDSGLWTIPNLFTLLRFVLIIPAVASIFFIDERPWLPLTLVAIFSLTDWVDGFLARLLDQYSAIGAKFDPLADRLGLGLVVIALAWEGLLPWWAIVIIASVDLMLLVIILVLDAHDAMKVNWIGKFRTALTMVGVVAVLAGPAFAQPALGVIGVVCVEVGAFIHIITGVMYVRLAWLGRRRFRG
ncbi:CDP-alcohol phosphatidyltransferase family protein [Kocuria sp.]|uniref:CDP-alcohol phosphatidyltransferase family protein n=1 Tax=Kocuria sp. TaxID=1871328 RepID=UPI0026E0E555|nr:CDP-alcohol phosphatidyltransferase family protein [Kocuria sp.]MDO5618588.1 CDP-alcohol phosphatidyltransferase family protein [Kocuria sp.]